MVRALCWRRGPKSMCLGGGLALSHLAALHPRLCWQGLFRVAASCARLCPWPDGGRLPLLGMLATGLWPFCLGAASSRCEPLKS